MHRHAEEIDELRSELEDREAKHAAYVDALTTQLKNGLMAAVNRCKELEAELEALRASHPQASEETKPSVRVDAAGQPEEQTQEG